MAMEGVTRVEDLERQIDALLGRKPVPLGRRGERLVAFTEENVQRIFGLSLWEVFRILADRFGYDVEEDEPNP